MSFFIENEKTMERVEVKPETIVMIKMNPLFHDLGSCVTERVARVSEERFNKWVNLLRSASAVVNSKFKPACSPESYLGERL
jgi:hypothetical protein